MPRRFSTPGRQVACLAVLSWLALGCAKSGPKVEPVVGTLLVDGKPAEGAVVTLHPVGGAADAVRPTGRVGADGRFRLTSFADGDGAPAGEYKVTVAWFKAPPLRKGAGDGDNPAVNVLPAGYANPTATPLTVTVRPGQTELPTIDVKRR